MTSLDPIAGNLLHPDTRLLEAIERMDAVRRKLIVVVDDDRRLLGTVSDGDIRRGLMRRLAMDAAVSAVMNRDPVAVAVAGTEADAMARLAERGVSLAPLLDDHGRVVGLYPDTAIATKARDNLVVIMAGGRGVRLAPLTQTCPKPMLKVAGRPLLESIIERLRDQGFSRFRLAVNYLAEVITDHFGDGSSMGVEIDYLREDHPRGTAGALSLLREPVTAPLVVLNGDVLTRLAFGDLIDFHQEHGAVATLCVREHQFQAPHGVAEIDGVRLTSLREKPTFRWQANAGIYCLDGTLLSRIPRDGPFDMPELLSALAGDGERVCAYPMHEYWLDIGRPPDFESAQAAAVSFPLDGRID
ncbi:nucleotidyltransferase family protein [Brevundimonas subvibrioides]|uniref:nucleotidyltransferase family protein n=1 Tax=Brevundimonas subvibrioides TaxID=74313 RepID=UPI0022B3397F|nr:nucleotidyltransferase family protein [Brevundimonas subvibrioides]